MLSIETLVGTNVQRRFAKLLDFVVRLHSGYSLKMAESLIQQRIEAYYETISISGIWREPRKFLNNH